MSTASEEFASLIGDRLAAERKRLGLSQGAAGDACGVSREMWGKYERGRAVMGTEVLAKYGSAGADVLYVLTGQRLDPNLAAQDMEHVSQSQRADLQTRVNQGATVSGPLAAAFAMPSAEQAWQAQQAEHRAHEQVRAEMAALEAAGALTRDEQELIAMFRAAGLTAKAEAIRVLQGGASAKPVEPKPKTP